MSDKLRKIGLGLIPAAVAIIAVMQEPLLSSWAREREATLPLVVFMVLASLLHPRLRRGLIITLCYGVAVLSYRDIFRVHQQHLPLLMDYDFTDTLRQIALFVVALLAATSGVVETIKPGTVWARRCYFAAASLYFTGLGVITFASRGSWQAVLLCTTGLLAMLGCVFAHRIVATELAEEDDNSIEEDDVQWTTLQSNHRARVLQNEWLDTSLVSPHAEDEKSVSPVLPC